MIGARLLSRLWVFGMGLSGLGLRSPVAENLGPRFWHFCCHVCLENARISSAPPQLPKTWPKRPRAQSFRGARDQSPSPGVDACIFAKTTSVQSSPIVFIMLFFRFLPLLYITFLVRFWHVFCTFWSPGHARCFHVLIKQYIQPPQFERHL